MGRDRDGVGEEQHRIHKPEALACRRLKDLTRLVGGGVRAKKRPSVETEGRLTIACHMKSLKNRSLFCSVAILLSLTLQYVLRIIAEQM